MDPADHDDHTAHAAGSTSPGSAPSSTVRDAPFPPLDIPAESERRNADREPVVPVGPRRGPLGPTSRQTQPESDETGAAGLPR
ncbi:MAG: hypothetical protein M3464_16980 [Chloroflexota bacterium]|nr:hypothetical protein [Chloroflexota bacterium]